MAGVQLGFLKFVLGFDTIAFKQGTTEADAELKRLEKSFAAQGKRFANLGKTLSLAVTAPLAALAATGIREAQETAAAMGQVNAALASMGPVAGRTAEQLKSAANAFEGASLFEADQVLKDVTANLLTFGNIAGSSFDQAQQAIIDLSARMGTDLQSATILVGKALNDPIKGMAAMGRAGIQFSEDQKRAIAAMVETGNVAGAQAIILGELKRQFGGAAQAAQNTDPWNKLRDSFKSIAESIGTVLLPLIPPLADAIKRIADAFASLSPETQKWIVIVGGTVAALGPVLAIFGTLFGSLGKILPLVMKLGPAWTLLSTALSAARVAAVATLPALAPFLVPLGALAVAVGAVYLAWKNWDKIVEIVKRLFTAVKTWIVDKFQAVINAHLKIINAVGEKFKWLYDVVVGHSFIPDLVVAVGAWMAKLPKLMSVPVNQATTETAAAFAGLRDEVDTMLGGGAQGDGGIAAATDAAGTGIEGMAGQAEDAKARMIESFGQMATGVIDSLRNMVDAFKNGGLLDKIQSVLSVVKQVLTGLGQAGVIGMPPGGMSLAGARAAGGPVIGGKSYLVGERGPELFSPKRSGFVHANGAGQAARVMIVPTPYFDAHVDGRAARVAAPMAGRAAMAGAVGGHASVERAAERQFP